MFNKDYINFANGYFATLLAFRFSSWSIFCGFCIVHLNVFPCVVLLNTISLPYMTFIFSCAVVLVLGS